MSLKYGGAFSLLAAACAGATPGLADAIGPWCLPLPYAALAFGLLAAAYCGGGPGLLFKRPDGRRSPAAWVGFAPYFVLNAATFELVRRTARGPATAEVVPGLHFGRRLLPHECGVPRWAGVLDLAAEFAEAEPLRMVPAYRSLPTLDGTAPSATELRAAVDWISATLTGGPVYVHCALGHGRSACVVIAYLLATGTVSSIAAGERLLASLRPGVGLNPAQRAALRPFEQSAA